MDEPRRVGLAERRRELAQLLQQHPQGLVAAVQERGGFVPMPDSVPIEGHRVVPGSSALHLVEATDRSKVLSAWDHARDVGIGRVVVHMVNSPVPVLMTFVDVREDHGVFISVAAAEAGSDLQVPIPDEACFATRLARTKKNGVSVFVDADDRVTQVLGWLPEELVGRRAIDLVHPDDHERAIEAWMAMLGTPGGRTTIRLRHLCKDGSWLWMEIVNHNLLDDPEHECVVAEMVDISEEMAAHEMLRAREQLLDGIAEALPIGLLQVDVDGTVVYTNERLHEVLDVPRARTVEDQLAGVCAPSLQWLLDAVTAALSDGTDDDVEVELVASSSAAPRRCAVRIRALRNDRLVTGAIVCVEDVTEGARLREELQRRASFDMLTGCRNRPSILAELEQHLERPDRSRTAVIFVDIDRFKPVNDRLGHAAGDQLLQIVGRRLNAAVRAGDIVGRIGGDEFLVVGAVGSPEEAMTVARRISTAFDHPMQFGESAISLQASLGVTCSVGHLQSADSLVAEADAAMYVAKRSGGGHAVLFDRSTTDVPVDAAV